MSSDWSISSINWIGIIQGFHSAFCFQPGIFKSRFSGPLISERSGELNSHRKGLGYSDSAVEFEHRIAKISKLSEVRNPNNPKFFCGIFSHRKNRLMKETVVIDVNDRIKISDVYQRLKYNYVICMKTSLIRLKSVLFGIAHHSRSIISSPECRYNIVYII